jgi:hypothetical protein
MSEIAPQLKSGLDWNFDFAFRVALLYSEAAAYKQWDQRAIGRASQPAKASERCVGLAEWLMNTLRSFPAAEKFADESILQQTKTALQGTVFCLNHLIILKGFS